MGFQSPKAKFTHVYLFLNNTIIAYWNFHFYNLLCSLRMAGWKDSFSLKMGKQYLLFLSKLTPLAISSPLPIEIPWSCKPMIMRVTRICVLLVYHYHFVICLLSLSHLVFFVVDLFCDKKENEDMIEVWFHGDCPLLIILCIFYAIFWRTL